jgi:hydroxybutyrate-dimer hydrolase
MVQWPIRSAALSLRHVQGVIVMFRFATCLAALAVAGCAASPPRALNVAPVPLLEGDIVQTRHAGDDDLLSAGLGLDGLRQLLPPASADAGASELRRRAIWSSWRGIADLRPGNIEDLPQVPGREFAAQLRLPGDREPHRVLMQLPDQFDTANPCLLVAPASGSRGVYGAIAVAAPVGLPRGCAIVYTDKGAGGDFRDIGADGIYVPHAHSGDNPEARWGEHVLAAARFGLAVLNREGLRREPFRADNVRIVATGVSNGGGAVLLGGEQDDEGLLDAVVAAAPNIQPRWTGMRPLYDYVTEAALYQPCLLAHPDRADAPFVSAELREQGARRCALLRSAGLLDARTADGQSREAWERLRVAGWDEAVLQLAGQNVAFDIWRAIAVTYASAYGRFQPAEHPCGFRFAMLDANGHMRTASALEQQLWRSDGSGIPPTAGVAIVDPAAGGEDPLLPGLMCLRRLWTDETRDARRVREGADAVIATGLPKVARTVVVHGADDALIPAAFTSRPYVEMARANGHAVTYVEVPRAQHFDAFLAFPPMAGYVPLLPEVWRQLSAVLTNTTSP